MAAGASNTIVPGLVILSLIVYSLYWLGRDLVRRYQLWNYVADDENLPDPLEILYRYRVKDIQNSETGGENE